MVIGRHVFEVLLNPFFLILALFFILLCLLWVYGNSWFVRSGFLVVFFLLILFSTGWLIQSVTRSLEDRYEEIVKINPEVRWVVVLSGGQAQVMGKPANSLLYGASIKRLVEGVRLYRQLPAAKLLLSGGGYGFEVAEAIHLSELASLFSIPAKDIVLETKSINTIGQIKAIKTIVHNEPFYLVTSAIHMSRSMSMCEAQGLKPIAAPTDYTYYWNDERWPKTYLPNPHNLFYWTVAMHELLGRAWAKLTKLI